MTSQMWDNLFRKARKEQTLRQLIKSTALFRDLSATELRLVENIVHHRNFQVGELVFRQGDIGAGMYIITSGRIEIFTEKTSIHGGESLEKRIVTELLAGDFFGDMALVEDQGVRTASALALEPSRLIGFFKPDLLELTQRNPRAGVKILMRLGEILGTRLRETTHELAAHKTAKN